jgi:hypothetical protein
LTTRWDIRKAIEDDPHDRVSCYAMADTLEEQGWIDLAFCYRWMGWYDRRPGQRKGERLKKRIVWYKEGVTLYHPYGEDERYYSLPHAHLPPLVYLAMEPKNSEYLLYTRWEQAVTDLARGLARMRGLLAQPQERKEG